MDRAHDAPGVVDALDFTPHGADDIVEDSHPRRSSYHDDRTDNRGSGSRRDYDEGRAAFDARPERNSDRDRERSERDGGRERGERDHHHHHSSHHRDRERGDRDRERERDGRDGGRDGGRSERERDRSQPDLYPPPGQTLGNNASAFPGNGGSQTAAAAAAAGGAQQDDRMDYESADGARHHDYNGSNNLHNHPDNAHHRRRSLSRDRGAAGAPFEGRSRERGGDYSRHDRDYRTSREERYERGTSRRSRSRSRSPFAASGGGGGGSSHSYRERRVYVGNLAYDVDWTRLKDFMREVGPVAHADVLLGADGRSKGCGVVEYERAEDAKAAIRRMNDVMLNGRPVFVREDRESELRIGISGSRISARREAVGASERRGDHPSRGNEPITGQYRQIFVANLPFAIDWKALKDMFRGAGPVERADVFTTRENRSKGIGTVLYESAKDVPRAVRMFDGFDWMGRRLEVREDTWGPPAERSSGSYRDGGDYGRERSRYEYEGYNDRGGDYHHDERGGRGGPGGAHGAPNESSSYRDGAHATSRGTDYRRSNAHPDFDESMADVPSGPAAGSGDQIYVRNLPFTTTEQDLKDLFRTCGTMKRTEILLDDRGRPRGSGIVRFEMFESADKAVAKFHGYVYGGRSLEVMYDRP